MTKKLKKDLKTIIINKSKELGLDAIGIGSVKDYIQSFVYKDKGKFFLPDKVFSNCKTIITGAISYNCEWNESKNETQGFIARYTTANFYKILSKKLKGLGGYLKNLISPELPNKDFFRVFVNSKLNDKYLAYMTGLGYFLKNSLISVGDMGPEFVIGELLIPIEVEPLEIIDKDCGTCNICISSCPTGALLPNRKINKNICIQHLSSEPEWPEFINNKKFIKYWGNRFFGCTDCIDVCPKTKNNKIKKYDKKELLGYIGTNFDPDKIFELNKEDYKKHFSNNQLSASWIPEAVLVRNALALLHNSNNVKAVRNYIENIDKYGWEDYEEEYLKDFYFTFLDNK